MICEIREDGKEVVLHHPKLSDILAMLTLLYDFCSYGERKEGGGNG